MIPNSDEHLALIRKHRQIIETVYLQHEKMCLQQLHNHNLIGSIQDLFLRPAQYFNNPNITNITPEALSTLAFAQVYVEDKWHKGLGWVHPYYNRRDDPEGEKNHIPWLLEMIELFKNPHKMTLNDKRYFPVYYANTPTIWGLLNHHERDLPAALRGPGFGLGNQPWLQAWDSVRWYIEYSNLYSRYGDYIPNDPLSDQDTSRLINSSLLELFQSLKNGQSIRIEEFLTYLLDAEISAELNVLRYVHAAARHREGLTPDGSELESGHAIDYLLRLTYGDGPIGRSLTDISAFGILMAVYTDYITPDLGIESTYTYIDIGQENRAERNKAINVIELMGPQAAEVSRVTGERGLNIGELITQYNPKDGIYDFLPYSREEVRVLIAALACEAIGIVNDDGITQTARNILLFSEEHQYRYAYLLKEGFVHYYGQELWDDIINTISTGEFSDTSASCKELLDRISGRVHPNE